MQPAAVLARHFFGDALHLVEDSARLYDTDPGVRRALYLCPYVFQQVSRSGVCPGNIRIQIFPPLLI